MRWLLPFITIGTVIVVGCSSTLPDDIRPCGNKISSALLSNLLNSPDSVYHSVVIILADSTGLSKEFPSIHLSNKGIALGHCTKKQVLVLCKNKKVLFIEAPKTSFPNH